MLRMVCNQCVFFSVARNKMMLKFFLKKRTNTNPNRGPFHERAPSRHFYRVIRGMIPHKTARGQRALSHLKLFDGVPSPYDKKKRVVIPQALKVMRLAPGRKFCKLGDLMDQLGWKHYGLIKVSFLLHVTGQYLRDGDSICSPSLAQPAP